MRGVAVGFAFRILGVYTGNYPELKPHPAYLDRSKWGNLLVS
jgi:hypothetical protein